MLNQVVGVLAAFTIGAHAFLLPPGVASHSSNDVATAFTNPTTQAIKLPCPGCVFPKTNPKSSAVDGDDDTFWVQGGARAVILNFTLSEDLKAVNINNWQVYPVTMSNDIQPVVAEVAATTSFADADDHPEDTTVLDVTGASIFVNEETISPAGDAIISVSYNIVSLAGQQVAVDGAEVKVLQAADGTLMIISTEAVAKSQDALDFLPAPPSAFPDGATKECDMLPAALCKWKSMVESKIGGLRQGLPHKLGGKGCGGRKAPHRLPGHIRPHFEEFGGEHRPEPHHGRPDHPRPAHGMHRGPPHHRHPHHHHFLHRFVKAFVSVLVPVIAGITMGMFVSLVGMAVGRFIAFMWIKFRRGGQRGYVGVAQSQDESEDMEKGVMEVEEEEALPVYEEAPAYNEEQQQQQK